MKGCLLCGKSNGRHFKSIEWKVSVSQKPISMVIQHLANCLKLKLVFEPGVSLCNKCFDDLENYDKLMVELLTKQQTLAQRLKFTLDNKVEVKDEEENGTPSMDIETFQVEEVDSLIEDGQLADVFNPDLDTKEEYILLEEKTNVSETADDQFDDSMTDDAFSNDVKYEEDVEVTVESAEFEDYKPAKKPKPECVACGEVFKSKYQLTNHIAVVHQQKQYSCNICGVVRRDEEYLELHMNLHEGKTENECRFCDKKFARPMNTLRHMRKHWDKKKYQCEKCGERFSLDNMLYNHKLKHEAEENPLICSVCNQSFKSRKTFTHHMTIHQENRPRHHCQLCTKSFTERYTLKMHMKTHSETLALTIKPEEQQRETDAAVTALENDDKEFCCVICTAKFDAKNALEQHLQRTHDVILK